MNDLFLRACRGERVERIPVWFMRQAGRSLPQYQELRKTYDVLTLTQTPALAAQVALEAVTYLGVDAAILFADIMLLPIAMGVGVRIESSGPVIDEPIDTPEKIARLEVFLPEKVQFLQETIKILREKLEVPLIGFSGAPFTLASYLIEGKPTRTWVKTKHFMLKHPDAWHELMSILSEAIIAYLKTQIAAGVQAVQLFDSWVGCLSPEQYEQYVLPHVQHIFTALKDQGVPRLHFATSSAGILDLFSNVDCEVIGVDWRISLKDATSHIGTKAIQGNLDPVALFGPWDVVKKTVDTMLSSIDSKKGYIFNLGHAMMLDADDAVVKKLIDYVHSK
jgi:uroporphyrinogen decarboxylase